MYIVFWCTCFISDDFVFVYWTRLALGNLLARGCNQPAIQNGTARCKTYGNEIDQTRVPIRPGLGVGHAPPYTNK